MWVSLNTDISISFLISTICIIVHVYFYVCALQWLYGKAETCSTFWTTGDTVWKKIVIDSPSICLLVHHNRTTHCKIKNSLYIEASRISDILFNTTQCSFCLFRVVTNGMNSLAHIKIKTKKLWIFTFKGLFYKHWTWGMKPPDQLRHQYSHTEKNAYNVRRKNSSIILLQSTVATWH